jgi:hypothetical protein
MILKYIIVEDEVPVVFALKPLSHLSVGKNFNKVVSAGFCKIMPQQDRVKVFCYGRSMSLNIESNTAADTIILENLFNTGLENLL